MVRMKYFYNRLAMTQTPPVDENEKISDAEKRFKDVFILLSFGSGAPPFEEVFELYESINVFGSEWRAHIHKQNHN